MKKKQVFILVLLVFVIFFLLYVVIGNVYWYNPDKARERIENEKDSIKNIRKVEGG